jgi:protein TonB
VAAALKAVPPLAGSFAIHGAIAALIVGLSVRARPAAQQALQVAVLETHPPLPKEVPKPKPLPLEPKKVRTALVKSAAPPPPQPLNAPPPPTTEAKSVDTAPVVITGITLESTSQGGSFAVGVGNTLQGTPERVAREPEAVKPYKAEKYAPAAQVTELPRPLGGESINLRRYYPPQALKDGFEGDVVLRLLIDADGTVAKVDVVSDPGEGLGAAAARMVRAEYRFSPATVNGVPVATTVPFTVHFTLN